MSADPVASIGTQSVHRSTIVNLDRVRELQEYGRGEYHAVVHDETTLKISRSRRVHLEQRLGLSF